MQVLEKRALPAAIVPSIIETLTAARLSVWCYQGTEWYVLDGKGPHVAQETATCQFEPVVRGDFDGLVDDVVKIVGVSDDHDAVAKGTDLARARFADSVSASASQPYYLDVTNPDANKGAVLRYLSRALAVDASQIATIGDMPNDVLMFADAGLSIAMGNADREVQRAARQVTRSNDEDGFAHAMRELVLR
jgi:Cof subfamily protein (haloacid dehalogenase superfamily)